LPGFPGRSRRVPGGGLGLRVILTDASGSDNSRFLIARVVVNRLPLRPAPGWVRRPATRSWLGLVGLVFIAHPAAAGSPPDGSNAAPEAEFAIRTTMDLLANRVHASSYQNGHLIIDAGSTDFLKYTDGGWKTSWIFEQVDEGHPAALVAGLSAQVFLPAVPSATGKGGAPSDAVLTFTARALAPKQKVSIFVNEKAVGTLDVASQSRRYQVNVPAAVQRSGDNRVRFTFRSAASAAGKRSAAAFTDLTFGPRASEVPAQPGVAQVGDVDLAGTTRRAISIPGKDGRLSFYLQAPDATALTFFLGSADPAAHAEVRIASDKRGEQRLLEAAVKNEWSEVTLPLGTTVGDQAVRIDLISTNGAVSWANVRLTVKSATGPAAAAASPARTTLPLDHIFVWMVDTLRADKVRVYNPKTRVETPNYDAFAADATRFAWAQVPGTWSLPSHASLLTGVYPPVHKATAHEARLSRDVSFIAEEMKKKGFKTALFSSNGYVSSKWGFDRGWDAYRNFIRENLPNGAEYLWKTARPWVLQNSRKREFAYLATVDPHVAYTPRAEFLKKYWNKPYKGPLKPALTGIQLGLIGAGKLKINDNDKAYLEALHDGEITQSDAAFATFIADLKKAALYDRSAIIVVSDHGDEFGEHGRFGHGQSVYQELTHVPLIIRAPGRLPLGKVVNTDVEIMDLYATILDLAGESAGDRIQGVSLLPLAWDDIGETPRAALTIDTQIARGLKEGRYRLVAASGRFELYDEIEDRLEQKDVAASRPIALRQMRSVLGLLHAYETRWSKSAWGTAANVKTAFTASSPRVGK
jgi:choline-sulfatase